MLCERIRTVNSHEYAVPTYSYSSKLQFLIFYNIKSKKTELVNII